MIIFGIFGEIGKIFRIEIGTNKNIGSEFGDICKFFNPNIRFSIII